MFFESLLRLLVLDDLPLNDAAVRPLPETDVVGLLIEVPEAFWAERLFVTPNVPMRSWRIFLPPGS